MSNCHPTFYWTGFPDNNLFCLILINKVGLPKKEVLSISSKEIYQGQKLLLTVTDSFPALSQSTINIREL